MRVHVLTLFPEVFGGPLAVGPIKRAREIGALAVSLHQIRDRATDRHRTVDDVPYGGGSGMVLQVEPIVTAIEQIVAVDRPRRLLLSAAGTRFEHATAVRLAREESLLLVCGRYEGVDARVGAWIDEEISVGDYVLSGGEIPALVVIDAIARLLPGSLGNAASPIDESYGAGLLEYPHYTRPASYRGREVPGVLLGGDHAAIARWRREQSLARTLERRPDLLDRAPLTAEDRRYLRELGWRGAADRDDEGGRGG
jgi:tRNA (guanine37-N1)-methyltransferase